MTCDKCGGKMGVAYTWIKGQVRKRCLVCVRCGYSFTTTETRD